MTDGADIPDHVHAAIERAKVGLGVRLLELYRLGLTFTFVPEFHGESGVLKAIKWGRSESERLPEPPRVKKAGR